MFHIYFARNLIYDRTNRQRWKWPLHFFSYAVGKGIHGCTRGSHFTWWPLESASAAYSETHLTFPFPCNPISHIEHWSFSQRYNGDRS